MEFSVPYGKLKTSSAHTSVLQQSPKRASLSRHPEFISGSKDAETTPRQLGRTICATNN